MAQFKIRALFNPWAVRAFFFLATSTANECHVLFQSMNFLYFVKYDVSKNWEIFSNHHRKAASLWRQLPSRLLQTCNFASHAHQGKGLNGWVKIMNTTKTSLPSLSLPHCRDVMSQLTVSFIVALWSIGIRCYGQRIVLIKECSSLFWSFLYHGF